MAHAAALLTLGLLLAIMVTLLVGAWPAISHYGLGFFTSSVWDPVQDEYGGLVMIYGTLATSLIALVIAVPVSFGIALFLTELSPAWLKRPLGTAVELLAARRDSLHAAHHEVMECLGRMVWESQRSGRPPDGQAYIDAVRQRATRN